MKRFWEKVNIILDKDSCWNWCAGLRSRGYGAFKYNKKTMLAHRVVYILLKRLDPNLLVCHRCDNKLCVRPSHLYQGTYSDNMQDCLLRHRFALGSNHGNAKLSENQIKQIKNKIKLGQSCYSIAKEYEVSKGTILHVKWGIIWKHVGVVESRIFE